MGYYKDYLYEDAITWTTDGANAGTVNYRAGKFYCTNVCGVLLSNEVKANQMIAEALNNVAKGYVSYVGNPKLMNNVMADIVIQIPTQAEEREQLSSFFTNLDHLITLHQYKCLAKHCCFPSKITHPWEQRKLGEIAPLRGGFAFSSNEYCDGGIPIVRISNILSNGSVGGEFVYFKEQENDDLYSLVTGDILLAMSGATTGKVAMIKTEKPYKYYQNQRVGHFTKAKETDYLFVATIVSSDRFTEQLRNVLVAGAQPNVSSKDIDSFEFYVPKAKDEQREIGLYFNHLENLITLHQRNAKKEVLLLVNKAIPLIINSYHLALFAILIISSSATTSGSYSKTKLASGL